MNSTCKYFHPNFSKRQEKFFTVKALLIHSIIIVTHEDDIGDPYETICLEGLAVNILDDKALGHGI